MLFVIYDTSIFSPLIQALFFAILFFFVVLILFLLLRQSVPRLFALSTFL